MSRQLAKPSIFRFVVPFGISITALLVILFHDPQLLAWKMAYPKLIIPLLRVFMYLGIGLLVGITVEGMGWAPFLARLVRPVMRFGNLKDESGAAFTTAFFSNAAANAMLMSFWRSGRLTLKEMRLSYLVNTGLPVFLLHLPTTFFVIVPLTGKAGILYLGLNGLAALMRTLTLLLWTRICFGKEQRTGTPAHAQTQDKRKNTHTILLAFRRRFIRIITITAPIYLLMYALNQAGLFFYLRKIAAGWVVSEFLPVEAAGVVVFAVAAEFTSGIAAAGALLDAGTLTTSQVVLALILGTIVATPIRALRHQLPSHAGIFTPRIGFSMLLQSQFLRITSLLIVTGGYLTTL